MYKSKEKVKDIVISRVGEGDPSSGLGEDQFSTRRTKLIHPPIETHWNFPSREEYKRSSVSKLSMLAYPLKFRESLKKFKKRKDLKAILEGVHDPKDEQLLNLSVNCFHVMLNYKRSKMIIIPFYVLPCTDVAMPWH
ncbi:hypothetical protein CK203_074498 [Vitis vinifera]|uniref:Uncharacterized protein n=1 Tax=Vitis vinifera TaxID=29760 RepID=A0A438ES42_VITVI|nr:hypothetical protein CK203_074498 [Vitis vinifera]